MIAAPALTQTLSWSLPYATPQADKPPLTLNLQVQSGEVLRLDGLALSRSELATALTACSARDPHLLMKAAVDPDAE